MELFGQNPHRIVEGYSEEFHSAFMEHMRRACVPAYLDCAVDIMCHRFRQQKHLDSAWNGACTNNLPSD